MKIIIPHDMSVALDKALLNAGTNEIGGQIYGQQIKPSNFAATNITFQQKPGTFARFIVDVLQVVRDAATFFNLTKHDYTRFNYIGEWHSHPSFEPFPSTIDITTMLKLVSDPGFQGNFAVLMIVKLEQNALVANGWVFDRTRNFGKQIELKIEQ
jgi:hypothetical protein